MTSISSILSYAPTLLTLIAVVVLCFSLAGIVAWINKYHSESLVEQETTQKETKNNKKDWMISIAIGVIVIIIIIIVLILTLNQLASQLAQYPNCTTMINSYK